MWALAHHAAQEPVALVRRWKRRGAGKERMESLPGDVSISSAYERNVTGTTVFLIQMGKSHFQKQHMG